MKLLLAVGWLAVASASFMAPVALDGPLDQIHWELYKKSLGKVYADASEDAMRKSQFLDTKRRVEQHNGQFADELGYEMGLSHLSDWTRDELSTMMGSGMNAHLQEDLARDQNKQASGLSQFMGDIWAGNHEDLPKEVDWRKVPSRVSAVKNQGLCASSYAFTAAGVLEGQQVNANKNNTLVPLSAQNLIDCSSHNHNCQGGLPGWSFYDVIVLTGIMSESDYPYIDQNTPRGGGPKHECHFTRKRSVMSINSGYTMPAQEALLQKVVATYGPVSATIYASPHLPSYKSGIFTDSKCKNDFKDISHSVLVVGYGTHANQGDYWILKNSWGTKWGEDGYFKLARNKNNMCGIVTSAGIAYPNPN